MSRITIKPVTSAEWKDLTKLFGPRGACSNCWCMWWRLPRSRFNAGRSGANRRALKSLIDGGTVPGVLAYDGDRAVGWCAIAPREQYASLERSRVLARIDLQPVWSIVCFFVARDYRRQGLTVKLIKAAVSHAKKNGARIVEGYPSDSPEGGMPDAFVYTGLASAFARAGFTEAARRSPRRAVWRLATGGRSSGQQSSGRRSSGQRSSRGPTARKRSAKAGD
jgi:GNAT superfamily N-acetyltransferase